MPEEALKDGKTENNTLLFVVSVHSKTQHQTTAVECGDRRLGRLPKTEQKNGTLLVWFGLRFDLVRFPPRQFLETTFKQCRGQRDRARR